MSEKRICMSTVYSDKVETFDVFAKVIMRNWHGICLRSFSSFTDKIGQSMSVLNWSWHLDRARNVVIGKAELVG